MVTEAHPLTHVERGRLGAEARWGPTPRAVDLTALPAPVAVAIRALVAAAAQAARTHKEAVPAIETPGTAAPEGHHHDRPTG